MTTLEIAKIALLSHGAQTLAAEGNLTPAQFLDAAMEREWYQDAIQFLAHKMPGKTAIQWARDCVRELAPPDPNTGPQRALSAVDRWLQFPDDTARWGAKEAAEESGLSSPADFVAMAVFLCDGSITPPGSPPTAPPSHADRKMAAGSILTAVVAHTPERAAERYRKALTIGRQLDAG